MTNNLSITLSELRKINDNPISLQKPGSQSIEADVTFSFDDQDVTFNNVLILELYISLKAWLDNEFLETVTLQQADHETSLLEINSEDGEVWTLESKASTPNLNIEIDIDELILELWKLTVQIEVDLLNQYKVDIVPPKKKK